MMKKHWFFNVFKVLHDFDMKLYDVSRGENVEKHKVFQAKRCHNKKRLGIADPSSCVRTGDILKKIMEKQ